jgi:DNA replication protein DnaC
MNDDPSNQERGRGLRPPARELATIERRVTSAGRFGLRLSTDIPLGTVAPCPQCDAPRVLCTTTPNQMGRSARYWSECGCAIAAATRSQAISANATAAIRGSRDEAALTAPGAYDIDAIERADALTLARFDPNALADREPYDAALRWLADIRTQQVVGSYRSGPPAALYLVGERGRGKTHLAAALLLAARRHGHRVAIVNEKKYLHQARTVPFGPLLESLVADPGERAWLTVIDDIGKHRPESERDRAFVPNAWYNVLDRRYNRRGWTIFTSERPLDHLLDQGTLDGALYSRIYEMTRGIQLVLTGDDQRLRGAR